MNQQSVIYIVGGGAIGKTLAFFLTAEGRQVVLVRVTSHPVSTSEETIHLSLSDQPPATVKVKTCSLSELSGAHGTWVLTNKSYGNDLIADELRKQQMTGPIVILQNGLGVEKPFKEKGFTNIFRCVLFATSQMKENGIVHFKPVASSAIGVVRKPADDPEWIAGQLDNAHFRFRAVADIETITWKKALANTVFNSICPLLDIDNGVFHRHSETMELADHIIEQGVAIANQYGISISPQDIHDTVLMISRASEGQEISTLQDIRKGRQTEIDTLNMEISSLAEGIGAQDRVRETWLLGRMIQLKSSLRRKEQIL